MEIFSNLSFCICSFQCWDDLPLFHDFHPFCTAEGITFPRKPSDLHRHTLFTHDLTPLHFSFQGLSNLRKLEWNYSIGCSSNLRTVDIFVFYWLISFFCFFLIFFLVVHSPNKPVRFFVLPDPNNFLTL